VFDVSLPRLGEETEGEVEAGLEELCGRLRRVASRTYRHHSFLGLPDDPPKRALEVADGFVAPALEVLGMSSGERTGEITRIGELTIDDFVERLDPARERDPAGDSMLRAWVVLGEPGSGKTTLCRWLAVTIAERESGRVPALLRVRDALGPDRDVVEDIAHALTTSSSVSVSIDEVRAMLEQDRLVVIIDGLDETGPGDARARLRDGLVSFAEAHPRVPMVVTSREIGDWGAPLLPPRFFTARIAPFDEARLEQFVHRWFERFERDPEARARGRASLVAALAAEPRARELARNPLLATLIALVHVSRGQLPGRRAELYRLIVELLLVTWPASRGRTFEGLDEGSQRVLLEEFALRLQERRGEGAAPEESSQRGLDAGAQVEWTEDEFVRIITSIGKERCGWTGDATSFVLVRRWQRWLVREGGIFISTSRGCFSFVHRSVMEFLAARGLRGRYSNDLEGLGRFLGSVTSPLEP